MAINLANQTGREGKLSAAYKEAADAASAAVRGFKLVPFDFHKQCGATNYAKWVGQVSVMHTHAKLWQCDAHPCKAGT